jgi:hypothetical protein
MGETLDMAGIPDFIILSLHEREIGLLAEDRLPRGIESLDVDPFECRESAWIALSTSGATRTTGSARESATNAAFL